MNVVKCELRHIGKLCELTKEFAEETMWPFTFDYDICSTTFYDYILGEKSDVLAVIDKDEILGAAVLVATQDFCLETQGFLHKFYIRKQYRKTRAAFLLMDVICKWFDERKCVESFVTSTSGISNEVIEAFAKLMRRYGFIDCGPTLARGLHG